MTQPVKHRPIRSFVRREGRMTPAQKRALKELLPVNSMDTSTGEIDFDASFKRHAPHYLEIGFGMGASLLQMAKAHPDIDYIGIEVHRPGVGSLLLNMEQEAVKNIRIINDDAVEVLKQFIPDQSLDAVFLFFPDPWHKKKHHKRRILQPDFVSLVARKLKPDGYFHMATDWEDYAIQMMELMNQSEEFTNSAGEGNFSNQGQRPETKYERRGQRLGHGVWDLVFERK